MQQFVYTVGSRYNDSRYNDNFDITIFLSINTPLHFESAQNYTDSGEITRGANAPSVISPKIKTSCSKFVERPPIRPR